MNNVTKLSTCQVACAINVDCGRKLADGQFVELNPVSDLAHELVDKLDVGYVLLRLNNAFGHMLLHATSTNL